MKMKKGLNPESTADASPPLKRIVIPHTGKRWGKEFDGEPPFFIRRNNEKQEVLDFSNNYEELWNYGDDLWRDSGISTFITDSNGSVEMIFD